MMVGKERRKTLVDGGASRSLLSLSSWIDHCKERRTAPILHKSPPHETLRALNGGTIPVEGIAYLHILGEIVPFYVVKGLSRYDILMGNDLLKKFRANVDYHTGIVTLLERKFKAISTVLDQKHQELASNTVDIDQWAAEFPSVFGQTGPLTSTPSFQCTIDTGDHPPIYSKPYRLPLTKRKIVDEEIDRMLEEGIIEASDAPWSSPICIVPKPDGKWRFCCDYRKLNQITVRDSHPLPCIQDILDGMAGAKIFSTVDLKAGYHQIPMHPDDKDKTTFTCHRGLYRFNRMSFGLKNAPGQFQRFMNKIFAPFIGKFLYIYLDDLVIYSKSLEEHEDHLRQVFSVLAQHNLSVKASKCRLNLKELKLLGFIINERGYRSNPEKIEAVKNLAPPRTPKEVRSFLGLTGYYRNLIPEYSRIALPLTHLTSKYVKFTWGKKEQVAFERLQNELVSDRILAYPDPSRPYKLYTDSCDYAIGGILCQNDDSGVERPIVYVSKKLSGAQLNYPIIEKEAWGLIYCLTKLNPYLQGAQVTAYVDHKPLKSLFQNVNKSAKIQRWSILLAEMGCQIQYVKGIDNVRADSLSRLYSVGKEEERHVWSPLPEDEKMLHDHIRMDAIDLETDREAILEDLAHQQVEQILQEDDGAIPFEFDQIEVNQLQAEQRQMPEWKLGEEEVDDYIIENNLLYTLRPPFGKPEGARLVLPLSCRFRVMQRAHKEIGHGALRKTLDRIQEHYKWPGIRRDVARYLTTCAVCQVHSGRRERANPGTMPIAKYPNQVVSCDMIGPLIPSSEGNKYILVVIDHCTGFAECKPLPNKDALSVLKYFEREWLPRYSSPEILVTDRGLEFKNDTFVPYMKALGVDVRHSSPYNPQCNGKVERFNKELKSKLKKLVNSHVSKWEDVLGAALWSHRISTSSVTSYTPFFLQYGRNALPPRQRLLNRRLGSGHPNIAERIDTLSRAFDEAARNTEASRIHNFRRLAEHANARELKLGDSVAVAVHVRDKLDPNWDYGYVVTRLRDPVVSVLGPNNARKELNRKYVKWVDPETNWAMLNPRIKRARRKQPQGQAVERQDPVRRDTVRTEQPGVPARRDTVRTEQPGVPARRETVRTGQPGVPARNPVLDAEPVGRNNGRDIDPDYQPPGTARRLEYNPYGASNTVVTRSMRKRALEESDNDSRSPSKRTPPELPMQSQGKRGRDESEDDSPEVLGMPVVKRAVLDPTPDALVGVHTQPLQRPFGLKMPVD